MGRKNDFNIYTQEFEAINKKIERRNFLKSTAGGMGAMALGTLLSSSISTKTFEQQIFYVLSAGD